MSSATEVVLDACSQDRALCPIRVDVPCGARGTVITQWACDCTEGKWLCRVAARNPGSCPDGGLT